AGYQGLRSGRAAVVGERTEQRVARRQIACRRQEAAAVAVEVVAGGLDDLVLDVAVARSRGARVLRDDRVAQPHPAEFDLVRHGRVSLPAVEPAAALERAVVGDR